MAMLAMLPAGARAQGFAGLGTASDGYAMPDPSHGIGFPADHGAHPFFRIEWWYLTAPLQFADGTPLGVQWTLFRSALSPRPAQGQADPPQAWLGHAAVTTAAGHRVSERWARGDTGQAGVTASPFAAWIDDWTMQGDPAGRLHLTASGTDFRYALDLTARGPLILQGERGFSRKSSSGQASHYYSQPFFEAAGMVDLGEGPRAVSGLGWLDREWSSQPLAPDQSGWDWFSLILDDGRRLMLFRLRGAKDFLSGTLIGQDGQRSLNGADIALTPGRTQDGIPVEWRVAVPSAGIDCAVTALNPRAVMPTRVPYWEGPVSVTGTASGRGYLEMTGYPHPAG